MPIRNNNWYDTNCQRSYPLDESATGFDDAGRPVPEDVLADLRLRFPASMGAAAWLSGLTVGDGLVTAVFQACDGAGTPGSFAPLAAVTVPQPVVAGVQYPLRALADGVGGWVAFGHGLSRAYTGRLSLPSQGRLMARCASAYATPPVSGLGREGAASPLRGLVTLRAGTNVSIARETRLVPAGGGTRAVRAVVFRLLDPPGRDVYRIYAGPCGGRPESGTCAGVPLESIDAATPGCDGTLEIEFRGVRATPFAAGGGVLLELPLGLAASCAPVVQTLGEPTDRCDADPPIGAVHDPLDPPGPLPDGSAPAGTPLLPGDPLYHLLYDGKARGVAAGGLVWGEDTGCSDSLQDDMMSDPPAGHAWVVAAGRWTVSHASHVAAIDGYPGGADRQVRRASSGRSVLLARSDNMCATPSALGKTARALFRPGIGRAIANGGVIFGHRDAAGGPRYFMASVDVTANRVSILRYGGAGFVELAGRTLPASRALVAGSWYEVAVQIDATPDHQPGRVRIAAYFAAPQLPLVTPIALVVEDDHYGDGTGSFGVGAVDAVCEFAFFQLF